MTVTIPAWLYHPTTAKKHKLVQDQAGFDKWTAEGWKTTPVGYDPTPTGEEIPDDSAETKAVLPYAPVSYPKWLYRDRESFLVATPEEHAILATDAWVEEPPVPVIVLNAEGEPVEQDITIEHALNATQLLERGLMLEHGTAPAEIVAPVIDWPEASAKKGKK